MAIQRDIFVFQSLIGCRVGDKELFQTLRIEVVRESGIRIFEIAKEHLPNNKTNTTRFYLKEGGEIKWCSKVAENMHEVR